MAVSSPICEASQVRRSSWSLLIATLKGMREAGYGYAVIGDPGPVAFYQKRLDALETELRRARKEST